MTSRRLVIGLGSGRCGTVSLRDLLAAQEETAAFHEHRVLPWVPDLGRLRQCGEVLAEVDAPVVAWVASYYLPYLEAIRSSLDQLGFAELRVVALRRGLDETVESFMGKTAGRNHWQPPSPGFRADAKWDPAFPKFAVGLSKQEAIAAYWREYYSICERGQVEIFPTAVLNSPEGQREILSACGYAEPRVQLGIWSNTRSNPLRA